MKPWILGLTGGIGSGKSAVAQHFVDLGVHLVDADHAARWVVEPGRPALDKIVEHFGGDVLQADGQLDRSALRVLLVDAPEQLQILRTIARDQSSAEQVQAILKAQASRSERLQHAHDVLVNDRDLHWLQAEVERLHNFYLTLRGGPT